MAKKLQLQEWIPTEEAEQEQVFAWAAMMEPRMPELALLYASMNGILTDARFGAKLKRLGRKKGCPDINLDVARGGWFGLRIEMKRVRGGVVSDAQETWIERLADAGYRVVIAEGAKQATLIIANYLKQPRTVAIPFITEGD